MPANPSELMALAAGDRVTWRTEGRGGYGYVHNIPAVVEKVTAERVRIRAAIRRRDGGWAPIRRTVKPESLTPRSEFVEAVDLASTGGEG